MVTRLHTVLNNNRAAKKMKKLFRNKLGDVVANELLSQAGTQRLLVNGQTLTQGQVLNSNLTMDSLYMQFGLPAENAEFSMFEMKIQFQTSELENYFMQAFEEMMKSLQHRGSLFQSSHSHACFAFQQSGIHNDTFQIGVLLFKAGATIDKVVEQGMNNNSANSGCIIVGKMLDVNQRPFAAVFNRGKQDCPIVVVGPNRIYFDQMNGDEFKIFVPNGYSNLPAHLHPLMVGQPTIELYCADSQDKTFQLGNEMQIQSSYQNDFNSNQDPQQYKGVSLAFATFFAQQVDYRELPASYNLQQALESHDLLKLVSGQPSSAIQRGPPQQLINRLNAGGAKANTSMVSTQNQVQIKKNHTQLMREKQALDQRKKASDFNRNSSLQFFQPQNPTNSCLNFGQLQNPRFALNNTFGGVQSNQQSSMTPSQRVNQFQMAVQNVSIGQQPRFQFAQNKNESVQKPFQQPQFNPFTSKQNSNSLQSSSIPKFNFNAQPQQIVEQQPVLQQAFCSQPVWQQPQPQFKFQTDQAVKIQGFQAQKFIQDQFQPGQQTFQFLPQPNHQNQMMMSEPHQQQAANTPVPVRFAVNGKLAPAFDSKRDFNQQQFLFDGLQAVDQEILKTCLQELSRTLTSHELKRAEMLMIEQPFQFYELYTLSMHQPQQVPYQVSGQVVEAQNKQNEPDEKLKMVAVRDFDDISLFIQQFAQKKISSSSYIRTKGDDNRQPIHWNTSKLLEELSKANLTPIQAINSVILSTETPRNDNFHKLFTQKDTPKDMVFVSSKWNRHCHQIVFQASYFLRGCMKQNNEINRKQYGENVSKQVFYLPEWISEIAIKQFIRFSYTSQIKFESQNARRGYPEETLDLFRVAVYFEDLKLQEALVANEVIPNMNASSAVLFLKHTSEWDQLSPCQKLPNERVNTFLKDYCMFHLTKNLPSILRQDKRRLYELNINYLWDIVSQSFNYIVDAKADIEVIMSFASDTFCEDRNIFHLFNKVHQRIQSCCGFDNQMIAKIKDIKQVDPDFQHCVPLIAGYDFNALQQIKRKNRDSTAFDSSATNINQKESKDNCEQLKPANNVFELQDGQPDTGAIKKPCFMIQLDLEEQVIRDLMSMLDSQGVSILSKAFNSERRSWHLKIDIEARTKNISVWIVERGETFMEEKNSLLNRGIPIEFSSVRCQIEIVDAAVHNRKSQFFFSFSHDQNQVVGHKDITNLDQLANCKVLKIKVAIEEFILHSAMMHHFASNFERKFKEECQKEETLKIVSPVAIENSSYGFFHFSDPVLFWLLSSDVVKVEDEHQILSFIFQHTKLKTTRKGLDAAILTANLLSKCLRFKHIDIYNLMSAIRKNESLQLSEVFSDGVNSEMQERLRLGKKTYMIPLIAEPLLNEEKQIYSGQPRKYFNLKALKEHGREKLLSQNSGIHQAIIQEVIDWALNSRTEKITAIASQQRNFQTDQTYRNLNQQIHEERARANRLAEELTSLTKKYEITTSLSGQAIYQQVYPRQQPYLNQQSIPISQRPPAIIPLSQNRPIDQKENLKPLFIQQQVMSKRDPPGFLQQKGGNLAKSFETMNLEDSFKVSKPQNQQLMRSLEMPPLQNMLNTNPTKREDRKPPASIAGKNDSVFDISAILERLDKSPATPALKIRAITNKYLGGTNAKSDQENCAIF